MEHDISRVRGSNERSAALLLAGGASRRMGVDKTRLMIDGRTLARRTAGLLRRVADIALEIGPGHSGLDFFLEDPAGDGPLGAIVAGRRELLRRGHAGPALVIACDMPLLSEDFLRFLAGLDTSSTVLPVVQGRVQPLCAKWGPVDLDAANDLYARGEKSLQFLANAPGVILLDEPRWSAHASGAMFDDVDTPDDARRMGLTP